MGKDRAAEFTPNPFGSKELEMKRLIILLLTILVGILPSCKAGGIKITGIPPTPVLFTITPFLTTTPVPNTPIPTIQLPTLSPTGIRLTSSATSTTTPLPTLTKEDSQKMILDLINNNGGCRLPCWWGIIPGKTRWSEAETFLNHLGLNTHGGRIVDGELYHEVQAIDFINHVIFNQNSYFEADSLVSRIEIESQGNYDPVYFREAWAQYSPDEIVMDYGSPSRVFLQTYSQTYVGKPVSSIPFFLTLIYDNSGFYIQYIGQVAYEPTYLICPRFSDAQTTIDWIGFFLFRSGVKIAFNIKSEPGILPVEKALGLTSDQFAEQLVNSRKCYTTPRNIWP